MGTTVKLLNDMHWFITQGQCNARALMRLGYGINWLNAQSIMWTVARM